MKKKFIVFYSDDGLVNQVGIWQKMSSNGKRMLIEFIDYFEMLVWCNIGGGIDTRYKSRIVENCKWMNTEDVFKSNHSFVELRDAQILVDKFAKSERSRDIRDFKGDGHINYADIRRTT